MYAIIKTGGKQYRVAEGQWLPVERPAAEEGTTVDGQPLLIVDGDSMRDGDDLSGVTVQAKILGHERGPKLRVVKFKPKRGFKRRNGHRQELTRIEVTSIKAGASRKRGGASKAEGAQAPVTPEETSTTPEATNGS